MATSPFQEALEERNWEQVEELWLEQLEGERLEVQPLETAARRLLEHGEADRAEGLLDLTLPLLEEQDRHRDALELLRLLVERQPDDEALRQRIIEVFPLAYPERENIEALLDRGQHREPRGARRLLDALDQLVAFQVGDFVQDPRGWGFGQVVDLDLDRLRITVDFRERRGHTIPLESASDFLIRRDPGHFECMRMTRRDELIREANEDPAGLIRRYLRSRGMPVPLRVIREAVTGDLVEPRTWTRLWNRARPELKLDPFVEMTEGTQPTLSLREEPRSREEEIDLGLRKARSLAEQVRLVHAYLAEPATDGREAFLPQLEDRLRTDLAGVSAPGSRVELLYLLDEIAQARGATERLPELESLIQQLDGLVERVATMETREYATRHTRDVLEASPPGWVEAITGLLATSGVHTSARDLALRATAEGEAREARDRVIAGLLDNFRTMPEPFFWISSRALEGKLDLSSLPGGEPLELLERHLRLVGELGPRTSFEGASELRTLVHTARKVVTPELVGRMAEASDEAGARRLAMAIVACREIDAATKELCRVAILDHHPDAASALEAPPTADEKVIWTTAAGLRKRLKEYDHLINVEVKNNGIALGKARELGDLSENAEWDAAREEERRLITRQRKMTEELNQAREIQFGAGALEHVAPGARVTVRHEETGDVATYSLLGPWDVDPDQGRISYLSHLGAGLLGRRADEVVAVALPSGSTTVKILEIDWATPPADDPEPPKESPS